jgi:molybdopterin converting factor small subunit
MITIRLFGPIRENYGQGRISVEAGTMREVMARAVQQGVDEKLFAGAIMFVNNKSVVGARRWAVRLKDGDEVALLSPVSGG